MRKSKELRRKEADERQDKYEAFTREQKLVRLNKGKFRAAKERKRLGFSEILEDCIN